MHRLKSEFRTVNLFKCLLHKLDIARYSKFFDMMTLSNRYDFLIGQNYCFLLSQHGKFMIFFTKNLVDVHFTKSHALPNVANRYLVSDRNNIFCLTFFDL
jgi:hypothetical protein